MKTESTCRLHESKHWLANQEYKLGINRSLVTKNNVRGFCMFGLELEILQGTVKWHLVKKSVISLTTQSSESIKLNAQIALRTGKAV